MIFAYLNQSDFTRVMNAVKEIKRISSYYASYILPLRLAKAFNLHIIESIGNQKYSVNYQPYGRTSGSERYYGWKIEHSTSPDKFWYLMGDLVRNLTTFKVYNGYFAGIPYEVMDRGGKSWSGTGKAPRGKPKSIAAYGWIMEEGGDYSADSGGDHPARPLFAPALEYFAWNLAPLELNKVVSIIESSWK
jgi:hypothetical protein